MSLRNLIYWLWHRGVSNDQSNNVDQHSVYIVKWIPKDQEVTIDHSTRYGNPLEAMHFATNILSLNAKRIWVENSDGAIQIDYDSILRNAVDAATVTNVGKDAELEVASQVIDLIREPTHARDGEATRS